MPFIYSVIHSMITYIFHIYHMPSIVLSGEDTLGPLDPQGLYIHEENKKKIVNIQTNQSQFSMYS